MATKDRNVTHRIPRIRRGQAITADYLNALADGANRAIAGLDPPRSIKVRSTDNQINEVQQGSIVGERTFTEVSKVTTIINIECPNDPAVNFDVERIDQITFVAGEDTWTFVLDWD